jgi:RNA polymerase sigma-70 factor (ECF subfamily)
MSTTTTTLAERISSLTPRLKKYAARHADGNLTADDLIQIATEEILTHCSPTDNDTYMLRLADWRMRNAAKRERSYMVRIEAVDIEADGEDEDELVIRDVTGSPEEIAIQREMTRRMQDIVRTLKPEYINLLAMLSEDLSHREIARRLGVSQPKISYHIRKIREIFEQAGLQPAFALA